MSGPNQHVHLSIHEDKYRISPNVSAHSRLTFSGKRFWQAQSQAWFSWKQSALFTVSALGEQPIRPGRSYPKVRGKRLKHFPPLPENQNLMSCAQKGKDLPSLAVVHPEGKVRLMEVFVFVLHCLRRGLERTWSCADKCNDVLLPDRRECS